MRLTVIITINYTVHVTKEKHVGKEYILRGEEKEKRRMHFPRREKGIIMSSLGKLFVIESRLICQESRTTKIMLSGVRQAGFAAHCERVLW